MSWLIPRTQLTPDQLRAVQLSPAEHRAIVGGPGSGKTQVLLHRARHLCDSMNVRPERFRILVFTNVLKSYIRSALRDLQLPEDNVLTFDHWCRTYYEATISSRLPWDAAAKMPNFKAIREAVMGHATGRSSKGFLFDFVLVDEGQDLEENVFEFLAHISAHVTVCLDSKQQIYETGSTIARILSRLGLRRHNVSLIDAYRVCPYLVRVAAEFIPDRAERDAFRDQARQPQTERETPTLYFADGFDDEKQMLVQIVRERLLKNECLGILFPQKRQVYGFAQGLADAGIEVEVPEQRNNGAMRTHDFSSLRPKLMPYHSAKGLTFDSVLMPRLTPGSFHRISSEYLERLLFVAITRATKWCYFSTDKAHPLPILTSRLTPLANQHLIALREGDVTGSRGDMPHPKQDDIDEEASSGDLDFL